MIENDFTPLVSPKHDPAAFAALDRAKANRAELSDADILRIKEAPLLVFNKPVSLSKEDRLALKEAARILTKLSPSAILVNQQGSK